MKKQITLLEALTGFEFSFKHLDGRIVRIKGEEGTVIKPDSLMTAEGLGLPFYKTNYKHGNLFVNFSIKFPDTVNVKQLGEIDKAFSFISRTKPEATETTEECKLIAFEDSQKNTHAQGGTEGDSDEDSDEEGGGAHGQRVGCQP